MTGYVYIMPGNLQMKSVKAKINIQIRDYVVDRVVEHTLFKAYVHIVRKARNTLMDTIKRKIRNQLYELN